MKPCPPCKYSPMCIVMGFDKFVGEVIFEHLKREGASFATNTTADHVIAEMLQDKANEIVARFLHGVPRGCPGRPAAKSAEVQVVKDLKKHGQVSYDVNIAVPTEVKRIKLGVTGPNEET